MHRQGQWASLPCYVQSSAFLARYLAHLLHQDCVFSLPEPGDDRFQAAGAQRDPAIPSSVLLIHHVSPSYLDANVGIGLRATEAPNCSTLQPCQTNQTCRGELLELLVAKGY